MDLRDWLRRHANRRVSHLLYNQDNINDVAFTDVPLHSAEIDDIQCLMGHTDTLQDAVDLVVALRD